MKALSILIKTVLYAPIANSKGLDARAVHSISPVLLKKGSKNDTRRGKALSILIKTVLYAPIAYSKV